MYYCKVFRFEHVPDGLLLRCIQVGNFHGRSRHKGRLLVAQQCIAQGEQASLLHIDQRIQRQKHFVVGAGIKQQVDADFAVMYPIGNFIVEKTDLHPLVIQVTDGAVDRFTLIALHCAEKRNRRSHLKLVPARVTGISFEHQKGICPQAVAVFYNPQGKPRDAFFFPVVDAGLAQGGLVLTEVLLLLLLQPHGQRSQLFNGV